MPRSLNGELSEDEDHETPTPSVETLLEASESGDTEKIKRILDSMNSAEVKELMTNWDNWEKHSGNTALHLAAKNGKAESIECILESVDEDDKLALLSVRNDIGNTVIHIAIQSLHENYDCGYDSMQTEPSSYVRTVKQILDSMTNNSNKISLLKTEGNSEKTPLQLLEEFPSEEEDITRLRDWIVDEILSQARGDSEDVKEVRFASSDSVPQIDTERMKKQHDTIQRLLKENGVNIYGISFERDDRTYRVDVRGAKHVEAKLREMFDENPELFHGVTGIKTHELPANWSFSDFTNLLSTNAIRFANKEEELAFMQLFLGGNASGIEGIYGLTVAHAFLTKGQREKRCSSSQQEFDERCSHLQKVCPTEDWHLLVNVGDSHRIDLVGEPHHLYRYGYPTDDIDEAHECDGEPVLDCALYKLSEQHLKSSGLTDTNKSTGRMNLQSQTVIINKVPKHCQTVGIAPVPSYTAMRRLIGKKIVIKGQHGVIVEPPRWATQDIGHGTTFKVGLYLAFELEGGAKLKMNDCGLIVHLIREDDETHLYPVAMLYGYYNPNPKIHQAVILSKAMEAYKQETAFNISELTLPAGNVWEGLECLNDDKISTLKGRPVAS